MTTSIEIQDYTPKSFVVRGETTEYKENLKALGGKWNSCLTDKSNGERFGGWIFFTSKKAEVEKWIVSLGDTSEIKEKTEIKTVKKISLEERVSLLESKVEKLMFLLEKKEEDEDSAPVKRLLK